jgi:hypothetical protein
MHVRDPLDLLPLRQMVAASGDAAPVLARQSGVRHGAGFGPVPCRERQEGERMTPEDVSLLLAVLGAPVRMSGSGEPPSRRTGIMRT